MMPMIASPQTAQWTCFWSTCVCTNVPIASSTTSISSGSSSALGWVRVSTTIDSPSLSRFLEMATDGSCHRSGPDRWLLAADVYDVAGADRGVPASPSVECSTTSRPLGSMPVAVPVSTSPDGRSTRTCWPIVAQAATYDSASRIPARSPPACHAV